VPDARDRQLTARDGIEREAQAARAKEQVSLGRDRRGETLEVRRDDGAATLGERLE
jgi:hypothetical protein